MHEQTRTYERDGQHFIHSGVTGQILEGPFSSAAAAEMRARLRSQEPPPGLEMSDPSYAGLPRRTSAPPPFRRPGQSMARDLFPLQGAASAYRLPLSRPPVGDALTLPQQWDYSQGEAGPDPLHLAPPNRMRGVDAEPEWPEREDEDFYLGEVEGVVPPPGSLMREAAARTLDAERLALLARRAQGQRRMP
jgi:hypothetical protein